MKNFQQIWFPCSIISVFVVVCFFSSPSSAKVFRNSYVSFELPSKWSCYLENTAWICRYAISKSCIGPGASKKLCATQRKKTREAIIILAAKETGPKDTFKEYYNHLKTPRPLVLKGGRRSASKIIHVKPVSLVKQKWIDGMHLGSEIPHYYTRYLATVKGNIAVLVTFSAHKLFYTKYSSEFFRAIKSLRLVATRSSMVPKSQLKSKGVGTLGVNIGAHLNTAIDDASEEGFDGDVGESDGGQPYLLIVAIILAILGVFVWIRGRR